MLLRRLIPFIFISVLFSQDYLKIYTIPPDHKLFDELIKWLNPTINKKSGDNLKQILSKVEIYIFGETKNSGHILIFHFKNDDTPESFYVDYEKSQKRKYLNVKGRIFDKLNDEFLKSDLRIINSDSVFNDILKLEYNNTYSQVFSNKANSLLLNKLVTQDNYVIVKIDSTNQYFSDLKSETDPDSEILELINLDDGKKQPLLPTNLKPNRFYYESKDSLIAHEMNIFDYDNQKNRDLKFFKEKDVEAPSTASTHVPIKKGEKLIEQDYLEVNSRGNMLPDSMLIKVKRSSRRTIDNLYKVNNPQAVVAVKDSTKRFPRRNINALVDEKYKDKNFIMKDTEGDTGRSNSIRLEYWIAGITFVITFFFLV